MKSILKTIVKFISLTSLGLLIAGVFILGLFTFISAFRERGRAEEYAPKAGKFIQTAGGKIFIQEMGPATGTPLVFIHGSLAWSETWKEVMSSMSAQGYRTIAVDLPPFGFSDRPVKPSLDEVASSAYSTTEQAQRILTLIEELELQKPVLVGHSFGASPTAEAIMMSPEKFSGLVLIDSAVDPYFVPAESENIFLKYFLKTNTLRNSLISATLTNSYLTRNLLQRFIYDPNDATPMIVSIYQQPLKLYGTTNALGDWLPSLIFPQEGLLSQSRESYKNLNLPTLIIWGEKDTITPIRIGYQLDELIPNSEMHILEEVGHIPQIEDVVQLNEALTAGLQNLKLNSQTNVR